jgi:hypothetical protein
MKRKSAVLVLIAALAAAACSADSVTPTTLGVDGAPQIIKSTFLTVTRQASMLAGYDATNDEWLDFAREVCSAGIKNSEDLAGFLVDRIGSQADPVIKHMWSTAADAATSAFCPIGRA